MKEEFTIKELLEIGYGRNYLRQMCHSQDFWKYGRKEGTRYKFNLKKLRQYEERREKYQ